MPKYEWRCRECSEVTEVDRKITEYNSPPEECAHCAAPPEKLAKKISTGTTFNLEGNGWFNKGGY